MASTCEMGTVNFKFHQEMYFFFLQNWVFYKDVFLRIKGNLSVAHLSQPLIRYGLIRIWITALSFDILIFNYIGTQYVIFELHSPFSPLMQARVKNKWNERILCLWVFSANVLRITNLFAWFDSLCLYTV